MTLACRHQAMTFSIPETISTPAETAAMQPDQVNTAGWKKAWTNLLNVVEQSFTPSRPKLLAVEVELVVGNPGNSDDELTLTIWDEQDQKLAIVTRTVEVADCDRVLFRMPEGGIELTPGRRYRMRLSGGATFGWKYVVGGYEKGDASFNGKPLLSQARSTFLFRTFGDK
jgi:hypothetical protein